MPTRADRRLRLVAGGATGPKVRRRRAVVRPAPRPEDPIAAMLAELDDPPPRRSRRRLSAPRWNPAMVWAVAALCVALTALGIVGRQWYADRRLAKAHESALAAAKQTAVNFVSVSASTVDRDLQRIVAGSADPFKEEFVRGQSQVRAVVVENKVESEGTVVRAALVSGDLRAAVVLVAIDATVRNTKVPDGRPSHYRIQVEMTRDGSGSWLVARLQFVG